MDKAQHPKQRQLRDHKSVMCREKGSYHDEINNDSDNTRGTRHDRGGARHHPRFQIGNNNIVHALRGIDMQIGQANL